MYFAEESNSMPRPPLAQVPLVAMETSGDPAPEETTSFYDARCSAPPCNSTRRFGFGVRFRFTRRCLMFWKPNKSTRPKALWSLGYCWSKVPHVFPVGLELPVA